VCACVRTRAREREGERYEVGKDLKGNACCLSYIFRTSHGEYSMFCQRLAVDFLNAFLSVSL
jgi:hypothetical protein